MVNKAPAYVDMVEANINSRPLAEVDIIQHDRGYPSGTEAIIFQANKVNMIAADTLVM